MVPKIDTQSKLTLRDAVYLGGVIVAILWGGFQLTSAVQANTRAIRSMTIILEDGFAEVRGRLDELELWQAVQDDRHGRPTNDQHN